MDNQDKQIEDLRKYISSAEESLEAAKKALSDLTGEDYGALETIRANKDFMAAYRAPEGGQVIEGFFDGENMVGPEEKVYPVPANYASKSKLVEGDRLKLTIADDGSFIFKQIGPVERKKIVGTLAFENNGYHVLAEGKNYNILYASVTYFKAKPGDKVTIVIPGSAPSDWAALENIIHDVLEGGQEAALTIEEKPNPFAEFFNAKTEDVLTPITDSVASDPVVTSAQIEQSTVFSDPTSFAETVAQPIVNAPSSTPELPIDQPMAGVSPIATTGPADEAKELDI